MTTTMNKGTPPVAPEADAAELAAKQSREESLRESRLTVSGFNFDVVEDDDDTSLSDPKILEDVIFKRGEKETISKVLQETEIIALKRTSEGFNEVNFTLGVLNCFLISYMVGACPQHLWLLYVIQSFYMIPRKFYNMWRAKPLNEALYYLDFCWMVNFFGIFSLMALAFSEWLLGVTIDDDTRKTVFSASIGVSAVLLGANILLPFVACLFHDVNTMTGFFIHYVPPVVMYTFLWNTDAIVEAWPNVFHFSYKDDLHYFGGMNSVAACSTVFYFMWWIFYVSFILLGGLNLPRKYKPNGQEALPTWDTVFHSTMRGGPCIAFGKLFRGRSKSESLKQMEENNFDLIDFFIYMGFHAASALTAIFLGGYLCFTYKYFHLAMLGLCAVLAVMRGANRYTYYSTKMYSRTLKKQFADILAEDNGKGEYKQLS